MENASTKALALASWLLLDNLKVGVRLGSEAVLYCDVPLLGHARNSSVKVLSRIP